MTSRRATFLRRSVGCLLLTAYCLLLTACALTYYRDADGGRFVRFTFGTDQQIGPVDLKTKTTRVQLGGAQTTQGDTAASVAGSVTEALKPQLLP